MIGGIVIISSFWIGIGIWLGSVRPYLVRKGGVVISAATWGLSALADCQQGREFARANGDAKALALTRYFILAQIGFVVGIILMACGI